MRVSEAIVATLQAKQVSAVFGIPGTQTLPLNEAIEAAHGLQFVMARHETAVSHQAWGYAETHDGLAASLVVPGPGDMNAMNGLKNALNDCTPLLHLSIETEPELRGGDAIHETPPDTYENVVKTNHTVESPMGAPAAVHRGIVTALTPPQGPVRIGIPRNFLGTDVDQPPPRPGVEPTVNPIADAALENAANVLAASSAPILVPGGGVRRARAGTDLTRLAEQLDAPVLTTLKGKGVFPEDHPLSAGVLSSWRPSVQALLEDSDSVVAIGTDLDAVTTGNWEVPLPEQLIHVTMTRADLGRGYQPAVGIVGDAADAISGFLERATDHTADRRNGAEAAAAVRTARDDRLAALREDDDRFMSPSLCQAARDAIPGGSVVTADGGGLRIWMNDAFRTYDADRYVQPGSWATMGTALPSAIGAAVADPDRPIIAMVGDGGLMMSLHELHTVVAESLPITTLVANNAGYAIISESGHRQHGLPSDTYDWDGAPIDFRALAQGQGMAATRVDTPDAVREALGTAIDAEEPRLVEAMTAAHEPQALHWMTEA
jgi:acetolactate synthase-1/2/3 large subunit